MNSNPNRGIYGDLHVRQEAYDRQTRNDVRNSTISGTTVRKIGFITSNISSQPSSTKTAFHGDSLVRGGMFSSWILNHTTTLLNGTTTLMRDFLPRWQVARLAGVGLSTIKGCKRSKAERLCRSFAVQQPLVRSECATVEAGSARRGRCHKSV